MAQKLPTAVADFRNFFILKLFHDRFTGDGKQSRNGGDEDEDEVDGKSISGEEDVDGVPLDGAALLKSAQKG